MISRARLMTAALGLYAVCALAHAATPAPALTPLVEGTDYRQVVPAQNTDNPGRIEVDEFFSYACPHCAAFFPVVNQWLAKQPADVVFRRVPISFERPQWVTLARAYYALQTSGDLPKLDGALFKAIHQDHEQLFEPGALADWVGKNGGSAEKFAQAYGSFSVNNQTVQADRMAQDYGVDSVPMLAVDRALRGDGESGRWRGGLRARAAQPHRRAHRQGPRGARGRCEGCCQGRCQGAVEELAARYQRGGDVLGPRQPFKLKQRCALGHACTGGEVDHSDGACEGGRDGVLHLHGLDHHEGSSGLHRLPALHCHAHHRPGQR